MLSDGFQTIWNYRNVFENNVSQACILTVFKKIGNCRNLLKTMYLKHAFWRYLKRLGTTEKKKENIVSNAIILTVFQTIWNCRDHFENNVFRTCILMVFESIWKDRDRMKTMSLKHAFWRYLKRLEIQKCFWK